MITLIVCPANPVTLIAPVVPVTEHSVFIEFRPETDMAAVLDNGYSFSTPPAMPIADTL